MTKRGFTLIELLIVIAILGTLAVVVLLALNPAAQLAKVRNNQRKTDLRTVANALEAYITFNDSYPITGGWWGKTIYGNHGQEYIPGLVASGELKNLPTDPRPDAGVCAPGNRGYLYRSADGTCYKFLAWCTPESPPATMNDLSDPFRDPNRSTHTWMVCAPPGSACCSY